ncbi:hypothetical protein KBY76_11290 [Synechococcus sp. GreenBA-s]|nr:hypothetical protein [Synechococcus sp. GreenBA-s]
MSTFKKPEDNEIQKALEKMISDQTTAIPPSPSRQRKQQPGPMTFGLALGLALLVGLQLGALPWRFRREIWQAQGAFVGLAVGVVIGRLTARRVD